MKYMSICYISFIFLLMFSVLMILFGFYTVMSDMVYFIEWEIITLNSNCIVMIFLFDWMSLMFMGFVFFYFFVSDFL